MIERMDLKTRKLIVSDIKKQLNGELVDAKGNEGLTKKITDKLASLNAIYGLEDE